MTLSCLRFYKNFVIRIKSYLPFVRTNILSKNVLKGKLLGVSRDTLEEDEHVVWKGKDPTSIR